MERSLHHRKTLESYLSRHEELETLRLTEADWNSIGYAVKYLAPFMGALRRPEPIGEYPSDFSLLKLLRLQRDLGNWLRRGIPEAPHPSLANALDTCHKALFRYHSGSSPVYIWAFVFDPSIKVRGLITGGVLKEDLERIVRAWEELEQKIFQAYFPRSLLEVFAAREELYRYINLSLESPDCNPVIWWKARTSLFPLLAPFALNILSIPGSALAGEYTYSAHIRRATANGARALDTQSRGTPLYSDAV
ncbi:hypothetical protein V5O48_003090 [Marasmius crinis-equi]|uniref:HAT C-terminal dimerisation domain-containing protein n=1 Tax=Marasmius crinis-equi TaxID=585013 RepID=A0ABR3FTS5_9AGAR